MSCDLLHLRSGKFELLPLGKVPGNAAAAGTRRLDAWRVL